MKKLAKILTKEFLIKEYIKNKKNSYQIADKIGCSNSTILRYLKKYNIKIRPKSYYSKGKNNGMYGKGKKCHLYIDGRCSKQYYCKCGRKISVDIYLYGSKLCGSCSQKGKTISETTKKKLSKSMKGKNKGKLSGVYKHGKCTNKSICIDCGKELKNYYAKRCASCAGKKRWQNKEFKEKTVKAILKANNLSPNKPETLLIRLLNKLLPKQYKFVGDGKLIVGGCVPDFVNKDNNKIIELYGDYWHSKKITGYNKKQEERRRVNYFKKYNFKTLIIWEHELKDLNKVKSKIRKFNNVI